MVYIFYFLYPKGDPRRLFETYSIAPETESLPRDVHSIQKKQPRKKLDQNAKGFPREL
jgi:hypothetical protein